MKKKEKALIINGFLKTVSATKFTDYRYKPINYFHDYIYLDAEHCETEQPLKFTTLNTTKGLFYDSSIENIDDVLDTMKPVYSFINDSPYFYPYIFNILSNFAEESICLDLNICVTEFYNKYGHLNKKEIFKYIIKLIEDIIKENNIDTVLFSFRKRKGQINNSENKPVYYRNMNIINYISNLDKNVHIFIGGPGVENIIKYFKKKRDNYSIIHGRNLDDFDIFNKNDQFLDYEYYNEKGYTANNIKYLHDIGFNNETIKSFYNYDLGYHESKIRYMNFQLAENSCTYGKCAFCTSSGNRITIKNSDYYKKINNSIEELKYYKSLGYNSALILDGCITDNRVLDALENANLGFSIIGGVRLSDINEDNVKQMKRIGLCIANVGMETYDNKHLEYIRKNLTTEKIDKGIELLHNNDIFLSCNFIVGLPYAPKNELENIQKLIDKFGFSVLNSVKISVFSLFGFSDFHVNPMKYNIHTLTLNNVNMYETEDTNTYNWYRKNIREVYKYSSDICKYNLESTTNGIQLVLYLYSRYKSKDIVWKKYLEILEKYNKDKCNKNTI